ncbi:hypothetical protein [Phenylobacterium sp.]|uniref:hypothetical protein n=1 Tax=Phenylobacterium sp. TaxID=1871053 RepID=UPI002FC5BB4F
MRIALVLSIALAASASGAWAGEDPHARFRATMDSVFGSGTWRVTGGYRTPERENELRAQGALTVPAGRLSRHSMGRPGAPGAYDVVVDGMSPFRAAAKLRRAGAPFATIFPEGRHGTQGPHLHLDPHSGGRGGGGAAPGLPWVVAALTPAQVEVNRLHDQAIDGDGAAQLALGEVYAQGRLARKDPIDAYVWTALAASNDGADAAVRAQAERTLAALTARMTAADLEDARRFVAQAGYGPVIARPSAMQAVRVAETGALRLVVASSAP